MTATIVDIRLRPLRTGDLPAAQALTAVFQWPHRLEDWAMMVELGRGLVAERDGRLVGTILYWSFGPDAAALGLVGVAPELQGQGIGRRLMQAALSELGQRAIVLHATEAGAPLYEQLGFASRGRVRQHQGAAFQAGLAPLHAGERLRPVGRSDPAELARLDHAACGMDRQDLLAALLKVGTGVVLDCDGEARGFAVLRRFGIGQVIGPVAAPDAGGARALIGHFLASSPGQFIRIDVPEDSGLCPWLQELGLADVGPVIRMVRGALPSVDGQVRCFALAGQSFG